jgi:hypothetical protein
MFAGKTNTIIELVVHFRLDSDYASHKQLKVKAETSIQELTALALHTSVSYLKISIYICW